MFLSIKKILHQRNVIFLPLIIQIDFEYVPFNAIKNIFIDAVIKGCSFHFLQAIWREFRILILK